MIHQAAAVGFNRTADLYEKGRPSYPGELVDFMVDELGLASTSRVLDLGAGTGKFTRLLVPYQMKLWALEPLPAMRDVFKKQLPNVTLLEGTAEAIPMDDHSLDAVVAAQAFHWFDPPKALPEIHRVLTAEGTLALIWNVRDESVPWVKRLTDLIEPYRGDAPQRGEKECEALFAKNPLFSPLKKKVFNHVQEGSLETMMARVTSVSYIASLPETDREKLETQLRALFAQSKPKEDRYRLPYQTHLFWSWKNA